MAVWVDFTQMVISNKQGISTAIFLEKQPQITFKYLSLPDIGSELYLEGSWYAWGSAGH